MALKYETARYEASYGTIAQLPKPTTPEVSFVGRSNVGKSSLLNRLLGRKQLARVSSIPGKTANINFFDVDGVKFVDLPGYGYAKVSKTEKDKWGGIMERYLEDREELCAIFLLVDVRHEPTADDQMMYDWIKHFGYDCVVVATKADKITRGQYQKHEAIIRRTLNMDKDDKVIITSSSKKNGLEDLWETIVAQYEKYGYQITYEKMV